MDRKYFYGHRIKNDLVRLKRIVEIGQRLLFRVSRESSEFEPRHLLRKEEEVIKINFIANQFFYYIRTKTSVRKRNVSIFYLLRTKKSP